MCGSPAVNQGWVHPCACTGGPWASHTCAPAPTVLKGGRHGADRGPSCWLPPCASHQPGLSAGKGRTARLGRLRPGAPRAHACWCVCVCMHVGVCVQVMCTCAGALTCVCVCTPMLVCLSMPALCVCEPGSGRGLSLYALCGSPHSPDSPDPPGSGSCPVRGESQGLRRVMCSGALLTGSQAPVSLSVHGWATVWLRGSGEGRWTGTGGNLQTQGPRGDKVGPRVASARREAWQVSPASVSLA